MARGKAESKLALPGCAAGLLIVRLIAADQFDSHGEDGVRQCQFDLNYGASDQRVTLLTRRVSSGFGQRNLG